MENRRWRDGAWRWAWKWLDDAVRVPGVVVAGHPLLLFCFFNFILWFLGREEAVEQMQASLDCEDDRRG